jgi:glycosyltransferase involved in cell wall biosynthesis
MAKFAVCIPVYNGADFLAQALASVAEQTFRDIEVIVSDNGSTDGTGAILDEWSDRLPLRVVRRPVTLPLLEHCNALIDEVDCEAYMVLCHDDYLARPDALALADGVLASQPDISSIYCDLAYVSATRRRLAVRRFDRSGRFDGEEVGRKSIQAARNLFGIPLAIRRSALGSLRYDPAFLYVSDVDLSWSLARVAPPSHIAEPLIANRYGGHNSTWSMLAGARREFVRLADKYGVEMNGISRARLGLTAFRVAQQKRVFGAYARFLP